jgi:uncharacterized protein (TIGR02270 family)
VGYEAPIRWDIIEEHLDEAGFLWSVWETALRSPRYTLSEIADGPEARLLGHLEGLVIGGEEVAQKTLIPALASDEPVVGFAAAFSLLVSESGDYLSQVLEHVAASEPEPRGALLRALELAPSPSLDEKLAATLSGPFASEILLVRAYRGTDPGPGFADVLRASEPALRARGLRLLATIPTRAQPSTIQQALASLDSELRAAALVSGCVLGPREAFVAAQETVKRRGPAFDTAALLLGLSGDEASVKTLLPFLEDAERAADVLFALGFSGRVSAADAVATRLDDATLAPLAAEAFSAITGLPIADGFARRPSPGSDEPDSGPTGPLAELPDPDAATCRRWWNQSRGRFDSSVRHLRGRPWTSDAVVEELKVGPARRRAALALDLAVRSSGAHMVVTDALSARQVEGLGLAKGVTLDPAPYGKLVPRAPGTPPPRGSPRTSPRRTDGLVVTATGLVTSLGDTAPSSCAASRAGVLRIGDLDGTQVFDPDEGQMVPATGHDVPHLTRGFTGLARLVRLANAALRDLLSRAGELGQLRLGLLVAVPSGFHRASLEKLQEGAAPQSKPAEGPSAAELRRQQLQDRFFPALERLGMPVHEPVVQRLYFEDATGFIRALQDAQELLGNGKLDACLVGGVDSYVDARTIEALSALSILRTPTKAQGLVPGEASAFLLLDSAAASERRKVAPLARLSSLAFGRDPVSRLDEVKDPGVTLCKVIETTLRTCDPKPIRAIGSLNGDERRAWDWGHALVRLRQRCRLDLNSEWYPALSFGEVGSATGPLAVGWGIGRSSLGRSEPERSLVWLMDDAGGRASLVLDRLG